MATITVRDLDDEVKQKLRERAAKNGRSMEAEVRALLVDAVTAREPTVEYGLGTWIHERFAEGGGWEDFELPDRQQQMPGPATQWLDNYPRRSLRPTATVLGELASAVARLPRGQRKRKLDEALETIILKGFAKRVLPSDAAAAMHYGTVVATRQSAGSPISVPDAQIAAVCMQHGATLATRNVRDFEAIGIDVVDPWTATPR